MGGGSTKVPMAEETTCLIAVIQLTMNRIMVNGGRIVGDHGAATEIIIGVVAIGMDMEELVVMKAALEKIEAIKNKGGQVHIAKALVGEVAMVGTATEGGMKPDALEVAEGLIINTDIHIRDK